MAKAAFVCHAVVKAVNLGGDTDTTAAVTDGLAGIMNYEFTPNS